MSHPNKLYPFRYLTPRSHAYHCRLLHLFVNRYDDLEPSVKAFYELLKSAKALTPYVVTDDQIRNLSSKSGYVRQHFEEKHVVSDFKRNTRTHELLPLIDFRDIYFRSNETQRLIFEKFFKVASEQSQSSFINEFIPNFYEIYVPGKLINSFSDIIDTTNLLMLSLGSVLSRLIPSLFLSPLPFVIFAALCAGFGIISAIRKYRSMRRTEDQLRAEYLTLYLEFLYLNTHYGCSKTNIESISGHVGENCGIRLDQNDKESYKAAKDRDEDELSGPSDNEYNILMRIYERAVNSHKGGIAIIDLFVNPALDKITQCIRDIEVHSVTEVKETTRYIEDVEAILKKIFIFVLLCTDLIFAFSSSKVLAGYSIFFTMPVIITSICLITCSVIMLGITYYLQANRRALIDTNTNKLRRDVSRLKSGCDEKERSLEMWAGIEKWQRHHEHMESAAQPFQLPGAPFRGRNASMQVDAQDMTALICAQMKENLLRWSARANPSRQVVNTSVKVVNTSSYRYDPSAWRNVPSKPPSIPSSTLASYSDDSEPNGDNGDGALSELESSYSGSYSVSKAGDNQSNSCSNP